jgi:hypothetical protein
MEGQRLEGLLPGWEDQQEQSQVCTMQFSVFLTVIPPSCAYYISPLSSYSITRGGHRHLQIGGMLDINLIPNLTQKVDNFQRSSLRKGRTFYLYLYLSSTSRPYVWNCSTFDHRSGGGGGMHKTTSGSHYLYIWILDQDAETLKYHSETGANC